MKKEERETDFAMLYGFLGDNIGYVHIYGFGDGEKAFDKETEEVVNYFVKETSNTRIKVCDLEVKFHC